MLLLVYFHLKYKCVYFVIMCFVLSQSKMFIKCITTIIYFFSHFHPQLFINAKYSDPILTNNTNYCPQEALIILNDTKSDEMNYTSTSPIQHESDFSIEVYEDNKVICPCSTKTCIPTCCPLGHTISHGACVLNIHDEVDNWGDIYFPKIYDSVNLRPLNMSHFSFNQLINNPEYYNDHIHIFNRNPCNANFKFRIILISQWDDYIKLLEDGSIRNKDTYSINLHNYCLTIKYGREYNVLYCSDTIENHGFNPDYLQWLLSAGARFISLPFLFLTFIVYSVIPELRNLHGFILRNYISFLFVADASIAFVITCLYYEIYFFHRICIGIAFVIHFSFFSSLFWLNVMCFDIWWTFGGNRGLQGTTRQQERKKCIIYSIYAWSWALLITGICLVMDFVSQTPSYSLRPQFGLRGCGFMTNAAPSIHFCAPVGMIIVCNITLFILTTRKIIRQEQDTTHHLNNIDSRRHDDKQRFHPCLKLFILMGINWTTEIIPWLFQNVHRYVWYFTSLINALHGVVIFIIFVWKRKIKRLLVKRYATNATTISSPTNATSGECDSDNFPSKY